MPQSMTIDAERVAHWAEQCAESLSAKERISLLLYRGEDPLTLNEVAEKMGYSSPSGPLHHIQNAEDKIKRFVRDLPWLSPPDIEEEAWSLFVHALFSHLKKHRPRP